MAKIGLLGGTFDPIHNGHIRNAKAAYQQLKLDEVWFIPVLNNPFTKEIVASNEERMEMIRLATKDYPYMKICDIELHANVNEKSYTYDTLVKLNRMYHHDFYFIIGYDQAEQFEKWYQADKINTQATLVAIERLGYQKHSNIEKFNMIELEVEATDISSTAIKNGDISALDPEVLHYMMMHSIYTKTMIRPLMSQKRYIHSLSVADTAREFALSNNVDSNKAYIAGLLHDIAKEMPMDQMKALMSRYYPEHLEASVPVWHQWLSAFLAKEKYSVEDADILQAITNHTTASIEMSLLDMCVYCADKYEPTRDFDASKERALCNQNIVEGFRYALKDFYEFSKKKNRKIDKVFFEIYKKYVEEGTHG